MVHAEKCPVCKGDGELPPKPSDNDLWRICHGCGGKGWIEVGSDNQCPAIPWSVYPVPQQPYFPIITYTYSSDRGL